MKGQGKELEEPPAKTQINKFNKRKGNATGASNNGSSIFSNATTFSDTID